MATKIPFSYELRPSKQVERKIIIEILNELRFLKYPISRYRYIWMPSITYYDFILFYKYLYIEDMIGFESRDNQKRMKFNCPYDFIKVKFWNFSEKYTDSDFGKKCILWLDYEKSLDKNKLDDIGDISWNYLKPGSVLIVTSPYDHPPFDNEVKMTAFHKKIGDFWDSLIFDEEIKTVREITAKNLFLIYYKAIKSKISDSIKPKKKLAFLPLFNITYNDGGCPMFSSGFLVDTPSKIEEARKFFNKKIDVFKDIDCWFEIKIPALTYKERKYIDVQKKKILKDIESGISLKDSIEFELDDVDIQSYIKHCRHYPNYQEGII